jgi:hypothetical protein
MAHAPRSPALADRLILALSHRAREIPSRRERLPTRHLRRPTASPDGYFLRPGDPRNPRRQRLCTGRLSPVRRNSSGVAEHRTRGIRRDNGQLQGSLYVAPNAAVAVKGWLEGSSHVEGALVVERGGTAAGSVHNEGELVLLGRQGGTITGDGITRIDPAAVIVRPVLRGGVHVYEWHH